MDPNQTPVPPQTTPTPVQVQPVPQPPPVKKGNKGVILVILLVALLLLAALGYLFLSKKQEVKPVTVQQVVSPTPTAEPTTTQTPEEQEVESVDLGDTDSSDMVDVENDISGL